jgi:hypothetical protein
VSEVERGRLLLLLLLLQLLPICSVLTDCPPQQNSQFVLNLRRYISSAWTKKTLQKFAYSLA